MLALGAASLAIWLYLLLARGGFWRAQDREGEAAPLSVWPDVVAVIPARDEAASVGATIASLLAQDYPGAFRLVLVDDESTDGTTPAAQAAARGSDRLTILPGRPTPPGWTGKLWAVWQGVAEAGAPDYLLLTDADIVYAPGALAGLVARAGREGLALHSLMARLACDTGPERFAIPAFVFFFQMLYPFAWVNDPRRRTAAAAGGCMLVRRTALEAAGGIGAIRGALIDDCALAAALKPHGPIRLALAERVTSLRRYETLSEIARMVMRSAYAQLRYSPWLLTFALAMMFVVFLAPLVLIFTGPPPARLLGLLAYGLMAYAFQPMLRFYGLSPLWGLRLPVVAGWYALCTARSALASARGRGGLWKGRYQERGARQR